jgi:uncharacterized sporulation protein YeaH/YhbH (DUF444 family)
MSGSGFVIDRREEHRDKSSTSRDRFIKRHIDVIKRAAADSVKDAKGFRDLTTGTEGQEREINIDRKTMDEPSFHHGNGGEFEFVLAGNDEFTTGDTIPKPPGSGGQGNGRGDGSPDGDGEDSFKFYLSREEFLRVILDDCALPDMIKKNLLYSLVEESVHAGFTKQGSPGNMDVMRSYKTSLSRRIGLHRAGKKKRVEELVQQLLLLRSDDPQVAEIEAEINRLRSRLRALPYFDPNNDLRFRHRELEKKPSVNAVMFCLMDVSGSMTENMKVNAKYFFMLLHLFLTKNYRNVDVIFVRHTTTAKEVDEETFFFDRESGGTIVSSGLEKVDEIIKERYDPATWNIYIAQASDGDNYRSDSPRCREILEDKLLPKTQYMVYVEMSDESMHQYGNYGASRDSETDLWECYKVVAARHPNLQMKTVGNKAEIYPVFRQLFEKQKAK